MYLCIKCKLHKESTEFHKDIRKPEGIDNRCKVCRKEQAHQSRLDNYFNEYTRTKKSECKKKSYNFDLTPEYLESIWTGFCAIFNSPITYNHQGCGSHHVGQAALDRKIPELGYVIGNVQWVSGRANRIKYNATIEELEMILKNMKQ